MSDDDVDSINNYTRQLYQVVDAIAELLSNINPHWTKSEWSALFTSYTIINIQEATTLLTEGSERYIPVFDRKLAHTNIMGDYFSEGLVYYLMNPQETN